MLTPLRLTGAVFYLIPRTFFNGVKGRQPDARIKSLYCAHLHVKRPDIGFCGTPCPPPIKLKEVALRPVHHHTYPMALSEKLPTISSF